MYVHVDAVNSFLSIHEHNGELKSWKIDLKCKFLCKECIISFYLVKMNIGSFKIQYNYSGWPIKTHRLRYSNHVLKWITYTTINNIKQCRTYPTCSTIYINYNCFLFFLAFFVHLRPRLARTKHKKKPIQQQQQNNSLLIIIIMISLMIKWLTNVN